MTRPPRPPLDHLGRPIIQVCASKAHITIASRHLAGPAGLLRAERTTTPSSSQVRPARTECEARCLCARRKPIACRHPSTKHWNSTTALVSPPRPLVAQCLSTYTRHPRGFRHFRKLSVVEFWSEVGGQQKLRAEPQVSCIKAKAAQRALPLCPWCPL